MTPWTLPTPTGNYLRQRRVSLGITVSFNASTLSGGDGNDTLWISKGASAYVTGDLGADIYFKDDNFNGAIYGGNLSGATSLDGADTISIAGSISASAIQGNGGNDTMYVGGKVRLRLL